jgi:hypothetical protein
MNQQWQVAGSAPEVYERELVPAVFGAWAPILVELAHPSTGDRVLDVAAVLELLRALPQHASVRPVRSSALISIPEC